MKKALIALLALAIPSFAQNTRWDYQVLTTQAQGGNLLPVYAIPGASILFYNEPSGSLASTYNSATSTTPCSTATQVVLQGSTVCQSNADLQGNFGAWFLPGQYMAKITAIGTSYNYFFTVGQSGDVVATSVIVNGTDSTCILPGLAFTGSGACVLETLNDAGAVATYKALRLENGVYWGVAGANGFESRTSIGVQSRFTFAHGGLKFGHQTFMGCYGGGDCIPDIDYINANAGTVYSSDQGGNLSFIEFGQQTPNGGNPGYYKATVSSGGTGSQTPVMTNVTGCTTTEGVTCFPSVMSVLLDITQGGVNGSFSGPSVPFTGHAVSWLNQLPTNIGTLPVSSQWGYALAADITPNTTPDAPVATSFTLQGGSGTFSAAQHVCLLESGGAYPYNGGGWEESTITSVSGTAPTQRITLPLSQNTADIVVASGGCHFLSFDAEEVSSVRTAYPFFSLDGVNAVYVYPEYGYTGQSLPLNSGADPETTDNGATANSGFHVLLGGRITKIGTIVQTYNAQGQLTALNTVTPLLSPNTASWAPGDAVEGPDFGAQNITGYFTEITQNAPSQSSARERGAIFQIGGAFGPAGPALGVTSWNVKPFSFYTGNLVPPQAAFISIGPWRHLIQGEEGCTVSCLDMLQLPTGASSGCFLTFGDNNCILKYTPGTTLAEFPTAVKFDGAVISPSITINGTQTFVGQGFSQPNLITMPGGSLADYHAHQGSSYLTDGLTVVENTPAGSPSAGGGLQPNGFSVFMVNQSTVANNVGYYANVNGGAAGTNVWAANYNCGDGGFATNLFCVEIDANISNTSTAGSAIFSGADFAVQPTNYGFINVVPPLGEGLWTYALNVQSGSVFNGDAISLGAASSSGVSNSQNISFVGVTSGGVAQSLVNIDGTSGNLKITAPIGSGGLEVANTIKSDGTISSVGAATFQSVNPVTIYSAAGTALPSCVSGLKGRETVVSDATTPTFLGTYSSGGAVVSPVMCNGTNWVTY
jgi:hypothetical protein